MAALRRTKVTGTIRVPGDKSISHRALILSALARGKSRISHLLDSADVRATAQALRALGAGLPPLSDEFLVTGKPARELRSSDKHLDCGNSGTTARLLAGVAAGAGLRATFVGDPSLSRRPMRRVAEPLRAMGADVQLAPHGGLPMVVSAGALRDIEWESPVASAQVKSAILLAALLGGVRAHIAEPHLSRDHTERMFADRGVELHRSGTTVELPAGQVIRPVDVRVPADPSSAAFFVALTLLADDAELSLSDVCLNETRTGFLSALRRMGGDIEIADRREEGGETIGSLIPRPSSLRAIQVDGADVPGMIDELPLLACVATRAKGDTVVRGASELRVKESDRIATLVRNLQKLGADAEELPDGFRVVGASKPLRGRVETRGDHRIAMAFGILGALAGNAIEVDDPDCVAVSYPNFWSDLASVQQ
ncbi:MAG: 3-phosphoshikimate 1-carboxyvinyltransferase [Gemmatimonadaceae bacterium]